ncbi:AAA family ATPase, partial [Streptomyces neyagawaensis]
MDDRPVPRRGLAGRGGDVAALTRSVSTACAGHPTLVLVEGPAGMGKTTLVEQVLQEHRARAGEPVLRVLRVTGVAWESGLRFGVADQLVRACGDGGGPGPVQDAVLTDPAAPDAVLETSRILYRQWTALQEKEPLVVIVDDAHWCDVESLRAVRSALRRMTDERVLVLLVARDPDVAPYDPPARETPPLSVLETLEFLEGCRDITVRPGPLTPEDVRTLAREAHGLSLDLPAARRLCHHTLGNPRHVTQLLAELPRETWHGWQPELPAPARCAAAVRHRLSLVGEAARRLVEAHSVLGEEATFAEATKLAGLDDALPAIDEARAAGLLTSASHPGRTLLAFTHPLVRAAVLTGIPLTRRAELHRRAAEIVADPSKRLAHRVAVTSAADDTLAAELDAYAAERAAAGEWSAAAEALVRASRLSTVRAVREDRLLRAVDAMIGAGDVPQATAFAAELESFPAGILRDTVLAYLAGLRGRPAEADAFLTQAWERCDPARHSGLMARICQRRVLHALGRFDGADVVDWARRAIELADPDHPAAIESEAVLGLGLAMAGRPDEALAAYEATAGKLHGGAQPQRFQLGRGWVDLALDAPEAARSRLEAAVPTGFRMGSTRISLWAQGWLARTQFALG